MTSKTKDQSEKNIAKLLSSAFKTEYRPDQKVIGEVLLILRNRIRTHPRENEPSLAVISVLSLLWISGLVFMLTVKPPGYFVFDWIKGFMVLSLFLMPFSSLLLMYLNLKKK